MKMSRPNIYSSGGRPTAPAHRYSLRAHHTPMGSTTHMLRKKLKAFNNGSKMYHFTSLIVLICEY